MSLTSTRHRSLLASSKEKPTWIVDKLREEKAKNEEQEEEEREREKTRKRLAVQCFLQYKALKPWFPLN